MLQVTGDFKNMRYKEHDKQINKKRLTNDVEREKIARFMWLPLWTCSCAEKMLPGEWQVEKYKKKNLMNVHIHMWLRSTHKRLFSPFFLITFFSFFSFYTMQWVTVHYVTRESFLYTHQNLALVLSCWMSNSNNILFISGFGFYYFVFWNRLTQHHRTPNAIYELIYTHTIKTMY